MSFFQSSVEFLLLSDALVYTTPLLYGTLPRLPFLVRHLQLVSYIVSQISHQLFCVSYNVARTVVLVCSSNVAFSIKYMVFLVLFFDTLYQLFHSFPPLGWVLLLIVDIFQAFDQNSPEGLLWVYAFVLGLSEMSQLFLMYWFFFTPC